MTILVTGAVGLLGSYLCKQIVSEGHKVIGLSRNWVNEVKYENFKICVGNILDEPLVYKIIKDNNVKTVFHLAAQMPYTLNNYQLRDINIQGTINVLRAVQQCGVEEFIFASSMGVYSDPPAYLPVDEAHPTQPSSIYGLTKLAGEFACCSYSNLMRVIILRYAGIYGVGMDKTRAIAKFVRCALDNQPLTVFSGGGQSNDFVYVDDAVKGTCLAWNKKESGIYNIGSGQEAPIKDLAYKIVELTNSKSSVVFSGGETDRPFRFVLDVTKAHKELGYSPHSLEDGLRLYIEDSKQV